MSEKRTRRSREGPPPERARHDLHQLPGGRPDRRHRGPGGREGADGRRRHRCRRRLPPERHGQLVRELFLAESPSRSVRKKRPWTSMAVEYGYSVPQRSGAPQRHQQGREPDRPEGHGGQHNGQRRPDPRGAPDARRAGAGRAAGQAAGAAGLERNRICPVTLGCPRGCFPAAARGAIAAESSERGDA